MAYVFLLITLLLWACYYIRTDRYVPDKEYIFEVNGYVVTAIIAALSANGILFVHSKLDLSSLTLGELEMYMLNQGVPQEEWNMVCVQFSDTGNSFYWSSDLDFG